jgi:putative endonuclease
VRTAPPLVRREGVPPRRSCVNDGERRALRHYRLRGYRLLEANARAGGYELDLVLRRGGTVLFVEVKQRATEGFGGPLGAVDREKRRRVRHAAAAWLQAHPETAELDVALEVAAVRGERVERFALGGE